MEQRNARRLAVLEETFRPVYVVWELTLACDQHCTHCGSRAGTARENELSRSQALSVVDQLAKLGTKEVVLIGGEAYLYHGIYEVIEALKANGIRPVMTTGGRTLNKEIAVRLANAGLEAASVSIDGLETTHDRMRASPGSFAAANHALDVLRQAGLSVMANSNFNRFNESELESLYDHLRSKAIEAWQVQLTTPLGRAADRPDFILQPYDLLRIFPRIAEIKKRAFQDGIMIMPGNNLGYFGPEETLLRSMTAEATDHWCGCQAGRFVLGIESDGAVKGCPSLQSAHYIGGNLQQTPLESIWNHSTELQFARNRTRDDLWGFCQTCVFAEVCLAGCTFTAHAIFGRPGNNPYCHFRARSLAQQGLRERLVFTKNAPGHPFDNGRYELVVEPLESDEQSLKPEERLKVKRLPIQ